MKRPPVPREAVYGLYWYFASERQQAFQRRIQGEPGPWTNDPILQQFKFCNVFRATDRVSQYLIRSVVYHDESCSFEDRLFQIVAFRCFSKIETWRHVRAFLGRYPVLEDLDSRAFGRALEDARRANRVIYTGAFILCANNAYGRPAKHLNHQELFRHMFLKDRIGGRLLSAESLQEIYQILHSYPLIGDFMAYQTAIDLNYSDLINFSEDDFTAPGPGALRGIRKMFVDLGDYTPAEIVAWMVERQEEEFARRGLTIPDLWGRRLHAIDCQGLFCETDKYCRQAVPELRSSRTRIKARFSPSTETINLFFPPKWGLNDKLPTHSVFGRSLF
jgi:5-hmdU DNA kinase, helical domain